MNKVILVGNLASDVETRTTNSGNIAAHFRIAVDRIREGRDGQRETDFFPVVAWGKTAGLCSRYLSKGRKVAIDGRLQARSFDAQDGSTLKITEMAQAFYTVRSRRSWRVTSPTFFSYPWTAFRGTGLI